MRFCDYRRVVQKPAAQLIIVIFVIYVAGLWLTNALLYFQKMSLSYASVTEYYLGLGRALFAAPQLSGHAGGVAFSSLCHGAAPAHPDPSHAVRAAQLKYQSRVYHHSVHVGPG